MANETNKANDARTKIEDITPADAELSEQELEQVAGGRAVVISNTTCHISGNYD